MEDCSVETDVPRSLTSVRVACPEITRMNQSIFRTCGAEDLISTVHGLLTRKHDALLILSKISLIASYLVNSRMTFHCRGSFFVAAFFKTGQLYIESDKLEHVPESGE